MMMYTIKESPKFIELTRMDEAKVILAHGSYSFWQEPDGGCFVSTDSHPGFTGFKIKETYAQVRAMIFGEDA